MVSVHHCNKESGLSRKTENAPEAASDLTSPVWRLLGEMVLGQRQSLKQTGAHGAWDTSLWASLFSSLSFALSVPKCFSKRYKIKKEHTTNNLPESLIIGLEKENDITRCFGQAQEVSTTNLT